MQKAGTNTIIDLRNRKIHSAQKFRVPFILNINIPKFGAIGNINKLASLEATLVRNSAD